MSKNLQHLVLVRHGENLGNVRRATWRRGEAFVSLKRPDGEEITTKGEVQGYQAGVWIAKHILKHNRLKNFEGYFASLSLRSVQTAAAMDFKDILWLGDERLNERNRGLVRGIKSEQHRQLYPESYEKMLADPLNWTPPGDEGESILDVRDRWISFYNDISDLSSAVVIGHGDQMWAAQQHLQLLNY